MQTWPINCVECYWNRLPKLWHILEGTISKKLLELPPTLFHGVQLR